MVEIVRPGNGAVKPIFVAEACQLALFRPREIVSLEHCEYCGERLTICWSCKRVIHASERLSPTSCCLCTWKDGADRKPAVVVVFPGGRNER